MTTALNRVDLGDLRPRPVRLVHLGLGAFFRAHAAWYTQHSADPGDWGISAYTGRSPQVFELLQPQGGLYTLMTLGAQRPRLEIIDVLSRVGPSTAASRWRTELADPGVSVVTLTVTEPGYHLRHHRLDLDDPAVAADREGLARLGLRAETQTAVGRLVTGLLARHHNDTGPLSVVSCDNLAANGGRLRAAVIDLMAAAELGRECADWVAAEVDFPSTVVDRVTPATTFPDRETVRRLSGWEDQAPVITEPFSEWVLAGRWPAPRPPWELGGARFVDDVADYQHRKLWMLNAAHSHLAYAGLARGHRTVSEAMADGRFLSEIEQIWDAAALHLELPADELAAYRAQVLERLANPSIAHRLTQIALDGSAKLAERVVPVVRRHRDRGLGVPVGPALVLGGWVGHVRRAGSEVGDRSAAQLVAALGGAPEDEARRLVSILGEDLAEDADLIKAVTDAAAGLDADRD